jgi:glycosyltransferase involved in cell wall biosynthesis
MELTMNYEDKKVAFLTAAYNGEKTLQRTIDSIKAQTHRNFVYYILNDGSSDATQAIINENAAADPRIKSVYFAENDCQKHFIAAIKEILTNDDIDYFAICDHDDEYLPEFAEKAIIACEQNNTDAAVAGILCRREDGTELPEIYAETDFIIKTPYDFAAAYIKSLCTAMRMQWGKLYRVAALRKTNIRVVEITKYGRDTFLCNEIIKNCGTVYMIAEPLYRFYVSGSSETSRLETERIDAPGKLFKCSEDFIKTKCPEYTESLYNYLYINYLFDFHNILGQIYESKISNRLKIDGLIRLFDNPVFRQISAVTNIRKLSFKNGDTVLSFEKIIAQGIFLFNELAPFSNHNQRQGLQKLAKHLNKLIS